MRTQQPMVATAALLFSGMALTTKIETRSVCGYKKAVCKTAFCWITHSIRKRKGLKTFIRGNNKPTNHVPCKSVTPYARSQPQGRQGAVPSASSAHQQRPAARAAAGPSSMLRLPAGGEHRDPWGAASSREPPPEDSTALPGTAQSLRHAVGSTRRAPCRPRATSPYAKAAAARQWEHTDMACDRATRRTHVFKQPVTRNPAYSAQCKKARRPAPLAQAKQWRRSAAGPRSVQTAAIARRVWAWKTSRAERRGARRAWRCASTHSGPRVPQRSGRPPQPPRHGRPAATGALPERGTKAPRPSSRGSFQPLFPRVPGTRPPFPAHRPHSQSRTVAAPTTAPPPLLSPPLPKRRSRPPARYLLVPAVRAALRSRRVAHGPGAGSSNNGRGNGRGTCPHSAQARRAQHVQRRAGRAERTAAAPWAAAARHLRARGRVLQDGVAPRPPRAARQSEQKESALTNLTDVRALWELARKGKRGTRWTKRGSRSRCERCARQRGLIMKCRTRSRALRRSRPSRGERCDRGLGLKAGTCRSRDATAAASGSQKAANGCGHGARAAVQSRRCPRSHRRHLNGDLTSTRCSNSAIKRLYP